MGKKAKHWKAGSGCLSSLAGGVSAAPNPLYLAESHKLAAAAGLGKLCNAGFFIAGYGHLRRDILRDAGRCGLAGPAG